MQALLDAAERLFDRRGLEDVTVEEIAATAGVAVSSIYNHFGSKAGLHAALVDRALDVDREYMDAAYRPDRGPEEQLRAAAEEYLRFYLEHPDHFRMLAAPHDPGRFAAGRETASHLAQRIAEQNARMTAALEAGIAAGAVREVDPEAVATVLWAAWNGIIGLGWRHDDLRRSPDELRGLLTTATDVIARGLLR